MIRAVHDVAASRQHVFSILSDVASFVDWMPGCVASKIVSQSAEVIETEFTATGAKTVTMGLRFEMQPHRSITFKMIRGKDLRAYSGGWHLMDSQDGSGTVVRSEMEMDPGAMVPKFMVDRMAKKGIEETGKALKKRVLEVPFALAEGDTPPSKAPSRPKRLFHVLRIRGGYRIQILEETYFLEGPQKP
jgi:ribosome-associated toxin RatA of RatAB toxin-antitoxin module